VALLVAEREGDTLWSSPGLSPRGVSERTLTRTGDLFDQRGKT
jgi:hypothetical protein